MVDHDPTAMDGRSRSIPIDRRTFLRGAGAGAGLAALPGGAGAQEESPDVSDWAASRTGRPSDLETDDEGWTVLEKSDDTRTVYVSSAAGDDANDGLDPDDPVETLDAGVELLRDGYPDWLCLRSGDVWRDEDFRSLEASKSGRSDTERLVVTSYGDGPRPRIETEQVVNVYDQTWQNVAFVGLDFYAYSADPEHPAFEGAAETGFRIVGMQDVSNVLWEDCRIRYFEYGFSLSGEELGDLSGIEFRRCIVTDCWEEGTYDAKEKSQGIWNSSVEGLLVEENCWDHNGHNADVDGAGPNMFNHNVYMAADNDAVAVRRNLFARGAAHGLQLRAGGLCRNNLFVRNAISVNIGKGGEERHDALVTDNVVLEGRMMDPENTDYPRTGALWGIDYGMDSEHVALVADNVVAHAIHDGGVHKAIPDEDQDGVTVRDNVVYEWDDDQDQWSDDWPAPDRSVAEYHEWIGGEASLEAFLRGARDRNPSEWVPAYAAPAVNAYVRAGFGMQEQPDVPELPDDGDDSEELTVPESLSADAVSQTMADLAWTAPESDGAVDHYVVDVDGTDAAEIDAADASAVVTGLAPSTEHELGVRAVGAEGDESDRATVTVETEPELAIGYSPISQPADGEIGDGWDVAPERTLPYRIFGADSDLAATVRALWNEDALYVLVTVEDDAIEVDSEREAWHNDSVELFVDADGSRSEDYGDTEVQYTFEAFESTVNTGPFGIDDATGVEHAFVETDAGYRLEVAVPWSTLGVDPGAGATIGFDVHVNDTDGGEERDAKYAINDLTDAAAANPDRFGLATLDESMDGGQCGDGVAAEVDGQTVCDVNGDGLYRDVNGDSSVSNGDVVDFFGTQHASPWDERADLFDFDGDDEVGQADVVALFRYVSTGS